MVQQVYRDGIDAATIITELGSVGPDKCRCPVCNGKSLSVRDGNGKVLVKCFKECSQEDVIAALRKRGLWGKAKPNGHAKPERTREDKIARAMAIWRAAKGGDVATVSYLRKRGIRHMPKCARLLTATAAKELGIGLPRFPALVFPIYKGDDLTGCHVIKLTTDKDAKLATGVKPAKQSFGDLKGGYVPLSDLYDPNKPMIVGEGIETVLSAMQLSKWHGIACTGTSFLEVVEPPEASLYVIAADSDPVNPKTGNRPGDKAATALADRLTRDGHKCRIATAPGNGKAKVDWNDVLRGLMHADEDDRRLFTADLHKVLTQGKNHKIAERDMLSDRPPKQREGEHKAVAKRDEGDLEDERKGKVSGPLLLPPSAPMVWAEVFVKARYVEAGVYTLIYYRGNWYAYNGSYYAAVEQIALERQLLAFFEKALVATEQGPKPFNPTHAKATQIVEIMKRVLLEPSSLTPPFMRMADSTRQELAGLILLRNGALDAATRLLTPPNPRLFAVNCLPFDHDPDAPQPERWLDFLHELWPGDEYRQERINLQKLFGLLLTTETRHQKIFMMIGPKRSGKGTIARVLTELLGKDNVVFPKMNSLTGEFGLQPMIDKQLAIISDARLPSSAGASRVAESLLSISGKDAQSINRKNQTFWTGKLGVRFLILTNELPRITDASGALPSRFIIWQLHESFYGKEDLTLQPTLVTELPGILNWSLRGVDRLADKPRFIMPKASKRALRTLQSLSSPVSLFIREWCKTGSEANVRVEALYRAWCVWSDKNGLHATSNITFGRDLSAQMPHLRKRGRGVQHKRYDGIALTVEARDQVKAWIDRSRQ